MSVKNTVIALLVAAFIAVFIFPKLTAALIVFAILAFVFLPRDNKDGKSQSRFTGFLKSMGINLSD